MTTRHQASAGDRYGGSGAAVALPTEYVDTQPASPATGLNLFTRFRGRRLPAFVGPSGQDSALQPNLFSNRVARWSAVNAATAPSLDGLSVTNTVAPTAVSNASTNFYTSLVRSRFSHASATAGLGTGVRSTTAQWFLSSTPNMGGFFFVCRLGLNAITATNRLFVGLSSTTTALSPTVNPSTFLNMIGFGADSTDTTQMYFMCNASAATATKVPLGTNFRPQIAATDFYEFRLFAPSGGGSIVYWSAQRLNDGVVVQGSVNTNLPPLGTMLAAHVHFSNGTTAAIGSFDMQSLYIESDN